MKTIKHILFSTDQSANNLLLILPILICLSIGCYLAGWKEIKNDCVLADGKNLVFLLKNKQRVFDLQRGQEISQESLDTSQTVCTQEVINIKENIDYVGSNDNRKPQVERTAIWKTSGKTYQFPTIVLSEHRSSLNHQVIGFIQKQYLVSSSREYITESKPGKKSSFSYKTYPTTHVFSLDNTKIEKVTNHAISIEKLGLDKSFEDKYLRIHPLNVTEEGILNFVADTQFDAPRFYTLDLFSGKTNQNSKIKVTFDNLISRDKKSYFDRDFTVVADRTGKFAAFTSLALTQKNEREYFIKVFDLETNQELISRNTEKDILFAQDGKKAAFTTEKRRSPDNIDTYVEIIVFDLQNGNQIAIFESDKMFKDSIKVRVLGIIGDEMIIAHTYYEPMVWKGNKLHLCKMNVLTKQIVWDVELE